MIAPLVALKKRSRLRRRPYDWPPLKNRKRLNEQLPDTWPVALASSAISDANSTTIVKKMAFPSPRQIDEIMTDDSSSADVDDTNSRFSEQAEDEPIALRPKVPFNMRANPFVDSKDENFLKMERYFDSLLRTPWLTVNDILEGTFDDHEMNFIKPQPGRPDLVKWQHENTRSYHENLETRFKGRTDTIPFKLACLYFGFPVEPLRMESKDDDESIYGEGILGLRGGGGFSHATVEDEEDIDMWEPPVEAETREQAALSGVANEPFSSYKLQVNPVDLDPKYYDIPVENVDNKMYMRLYSWQGAMDTTLDYGEFVSQVDRLISNWNREDRYICLEVWDASNVRLVESAKGIIQRKKRDASDPIWDLVQKYFNAQNFKKYAFFVHPGDEDHDAEWSRHGTYKPKNSDGHVVCIENAQNEVAYMRVPRELAQEHQSHQFSHEYTEAMKVLLFPGAPHAWVSYQQGLIGDSYQYLDPPDGLWKQVIQRVIQRREVWETDDWPIPPTISFKLLHINPDKVPVIIPGVFRSKRLPGLTRDDFDKSDNIVAQRALNKLQGVVEVAMGKSGLKKNWNGLEIWCPAADFKDISQEPIRINLPGGTVDSTSVRDWRKFLGAGVIPNSSFALVVRPTYKTYRIRTPSGDAVNVHIDELDDIENFKAFVRNHLYSHYDPQNRSRALFLEPAAENSDQPDFTIRQETTADEWQWILRNIIEPDLVVMLEKADNEWLIPEDAVWGPRYVQSGPIPSPLKPPQHIRHDWLDGLDTTEELKHPYLPTPSALNKPMPDKPTLIKPTPFNPTLNNLRPDNPTLGKKSLDFLFQYTQNTFAEATKTRMLRDLSFTNPPSIFTNPLKPVMPLNGPPLESIIKTGPAMPGVSIAMMTPTEMLRLQREVHALRVRLLDRTRECPYTDCAMTFRFGDGANLDRHVREHHAVLRCFLCSKEKYLLPQYNLEQIQNHFLAEHLDDIVEVYRENNKQPSIPESRETRCKLFSLCGTVTTYMTEKQLAAHMNWHKVFHVSPAENPVWDDTPDESEEEPEEPERVGTQQKRSPWIEQIYQPESSESDFSSVSLSPLPSPRRDTQAKEPQGLAASIPSPFPIPQAPAPSPIPPAQKPSPAPEKPTTPEPSPDGKKKRKRPADLDTTYRKKRIGSGEEDVEYEYSERSAVPDPPANIAAANGEGEDEVEDEALPLPAPRKKRAAKKTPRTPAPAPAREPEAPAEEPAVAAPVGRVTRTGRAVRATRKAAEGEDEVKGKGKGKGRGKGRVSEAKTRGKGKKKDEDVDA